MGFFGGLGRLVKGEPVFRPEDISVEEQQQAADLTPGTSAEKVVTIVRIGQVQCHLSGSNLEVYAVIKNESRQQLMLDKISLAGASRELDKSLQAGEAQQLLIYQGPTLTREPSGYAEIQYRTDDSDYFLAQHVIRTHRESDGTIRITELLLQTPIHDIQ